MKKILLGTSALVFAGMLSTAASAAEPLKLSISGFSDWYIGYANQDSGITGGNVNDVDVMGNVEVHFKGEVVLENGMKAGAVVALNGGTHAYDPEADDTIKYSYAYLETAFGRTLIGLQDSVAKQMYIGAKDVGAFGINESHIANFLAYETGLVGQAAWINTGDRKNMISYVTPCMNGFMLGVSYVPGSDLNSDDNTMIRGTKDWSNTVAVGDERMVLRESVIAAATYKMNLDKGTTLGFSAAMASSGVRNEEVTALGPIVTDNTNERLWEYSFGVQFAKNGLFVGGGYKRFHIEGDGHADEYRVWNGSVGYENNKYAASLSYQGSRFHGIDSEMFLLSGKYKLSAGVDVFASFALVNEEVENDVTNKTDKMDSQIIATGVQLKF